MNLLTSSQWHQCFWEVPRPVLDCPHPCQRTEGDALSHIKSLSSEHVTAVVGQHLQRWPFLCAPKTPCQAGIRTKGGRPKAIRFDKTSSANELCLVAKEIHFSSLILFICKERKESRNELHFSQHGKRGVSVQNIDLLQCLLGDKGPNNSDAFQFVRELTPYWKAISASHKMWPQLVVREEVNISWKQ